MPNIQISDLTFSRLQAHAAPLVDSAETALIKVLDIADAAIKGDKRGRWTTPIAGAPDLTHTTLKSAVIDGKPLHPASCNWNGLMMAVAEQAMAHLPEGEKIADLLVVNHVQGRKDGNGYKFLENLGISIQGQNSNNAWKAISHLAKSTGTKVVVHFFWNNHPKAAKPGEMGSLTA